MRIVVSFGCLAAALSAQANWSLQSPPAGFGPREGHGLVHDPATQRTFAMFGTAAAPTFGCAMWDGAAWMPSTLSGTSPVFVGREVAIADDGNGALLMFGGWRPGIGIGGGTPAVSDQTWSIVASTSGALQFTLLSPPTRPSARQGARMVRTNQGLLLFGGAAVSGFPVFGDTWLWSANAWTQVPTPVAPSARAFAAMAFDAIRNVVVLFGGSGGGDTWEFDGVAWQQRTPAHNPPPRSRAAFAWSPVSGTCVLFGGAGTANQDLGDTWEWDGTDWRQLTAFGAPSPRQGTAMAFDPAAQRLLLCGGRQQSTWLDDTYYLDLVAGAASYTPFGAGCVGPTSQVPLLAQAPGELPIVGTTSHLVTSNLPIALTLPVFVLGLSNTFQPAPGYPLPLDLAFLGWPGCQQLVSHDAFEPVPTLTGSATLPFPVPLHLGLVGVTFHAQALVLYQPTGAAVSNALTGVVGF